MNNQPGLGASAVNAAPSALNPQQAKLITDLLALSRQARSGANWFFWIAALSVVNTLIALFGGSLNFVVGLGATQLLDGIAQAVIEDMTTGSSGILIVRAISFILDLSVVGLFVFFGFFARKGHTWAFITGMVLYFLDALIFLLVGSWMSIAFHAIALLGLFSGLQAFGKLKKIRAALDGPSVITPA